VINSREEAQRYKHCTHIHGEIEIRVSESRFLNLLRIFIKPFYNNRELTLDLFLCKV
jgi:hypothetical protein